MQKSKLQNLFWILAATSLLSGCSNAASKTKSAKPSNLTVNASPTETPQSAAAVGKVGVLKSPTTQPTPLDEVNDNPLSNLPSVTAEISENPTPTAPPSPTAGPAKCSGKLIDGLCFYSGSLQGQSCDQVCQPNGGYDKGVEAKLNLAMCKAAADATGMTYTHATAGLDFWPYLDPEHPADAQGNQQIKIHDTGVKGDCSVNTGGIYGSKVVLLVQAASEQTASWGGPGAFRICACKN